MSFASSLFFFLPFFIFFLLFFIDEGDAFSSLSFLYFPRKFHQFFFFFAHVFSLNHFSLFTFTEIYINTFTLFTFLMHLVSDEDRGSMRRGRRRGEEKKRRRRRRKHWCIRSRASAGLRTQKNGLKNFSLIEVKNTQNLFTIPINMWCSSDVSWRLETPHMAEDHVHYSILKNRWKFFFFLQYQLFAFPERPLFISYCIYKSFFFFFLLILKSYR